MIVYPDGHNSMQDCLTMPFRIIISMFFYPLFFVGLVLSAININYISNNDNHIKDIMNYVIWAAIIYSILVSVYCKLRRRHLKKKKREELGDPYYDPSEAKEYGYNTFKEVNIGSLISGILVFGILNLVF